MAWTANNKYFLTGSITSGLTLSINNADSGTVPTDMSLTTYDDGTYGDYTYELTAIYEGTFESSFSSNNIDWTSVGETNDIKFQYAKSDDGITYDDYSTLADAIGTTNFQISAAYFKLRLIFYSSKWSDSDSFQIDTISRKFTVFANGELIDANDWMSNYYVVGSDDLLPRGGNNMLLTNSAYDIGSVAQEYNNVYINDLDVTGKIGGALNLISSVVLSAAAQKIEFTGLNLETYLIKAAFIINTSTSDNSLLFFNGDSATNYGYSGIYSNTGFDVTSTSGIYIGQGDSGTSYYGNFEGWISVQPGHQKFLTGLGSKGCGTATIAHNFIIGGIWENSSDTVTSIQLYNNSKFEVGTEVSIWAKI